MRIVEMWRQRRARAGLYSTAAYWDSKAASLQGAAVSMWPNNTLNALYEQEQLSCLDGFLSQVAGTEVLDVGCGTGRISRHLARRGARVTAFDFSAGAVAIAEREPGPPITYRVQSLFELTDTAAYDVAVSWGTVTIACRNRAELRDALDRIRRALRPGGRAVLLEPVHRGFVARVLQMDLDEFVAVAADVGFVCEARQELHFWPARLALAFWSLPAVLTKVGYTLGQLLLRLPPLQHLGDYKAVVLRVPQ